jgi:hypothetical protein
MQGVSYTSFCFILEDGSSEKTQIKGTLEHVHMWSHCDVTSKQCCAAAQNNARSTAQQNPWEETYPLVGQHETMLDRTTVGLTHVLEQQQGVRVATDLPGQGRLPQSGSATCSAASFWQRRT